MVFLSVGVFVLADTLRLRLSVPCLRSSRHKSGRIRSLVDLLLAGQHNVTLHNDLLPPLMVAKIAADLRVRSPHTSGGWRWLSCRQPLCL